MLEPQTLTITTADKHHFNATLYSTQDEHAPVLIFLAALGTPARVYGRFSREMIAHGVQVCTADWRGIGSSSVRAGRSSDFSYRHLVEFDLASLIQAVRKSLPHAPIWLGGHSLGGQMSLLRAGAHPDDISGVVLIASGSVHLPCFPWKLRLGIRALVYLHRATRPVLGYFPGSRFGFGGREASGLMHDWSHVALTGKYKPRGATADYERLLNSLEMPVLSLSFAADTWSPYHAAKALVDKVPGSISKHWHWSQADSKGVALDHYSWLKQPVLVAPAVANFIKVG